MVKETPTTHKNVVFMRVFGVFLSLNGLLFILCEREKFYYFLYASNNFVISGGFQNREDAVYWAQNTKHACLKIQSRANKKENAL